MSCVPPFQPEASLGPAPHSGCPLPPGSLASWPRARLNHRTMCATCLRNMTQSSQPCRSSVWCARCCRTQKGCRGSLLHALPDTPKGLHGNPAPPPEQGPVASLMDQMYWTEEQYEVETLEPTVTFSRTFTQTPLGLFPQS